MEQTPFENLKTKLREAGCRVETGDQFKTTLGSLCNLLLVYTQGSSFPVRCLVINEGDEGYHLFIENAAIAIDADVQAILTTDLANRLEKTTA